MKPTSASPVTREFTSYKQELDDKHDRHERLVKLSRDVTIESKRVIFLLHRALSDNQQSVCAEAAKTVDKIIQGPLRRISEELRRQDRFLFHRAISPGLQEFVEAYTLLGYLRSDSIPLHSEICDRLVYLPIRDTTGPDYRLQEHTMQPEEINRSTYKKLNYKDMRPDVQTESAMDSSTDRTLVDLSPIDYILGIADLTGELMRRAVGSVSRGDLDTPPALCKLLQVIEAQFRLACSELGRDALNKLNVLAQSTVKVEKCCYAIKLRGSELPQHLLASSIEQK